MKKTYAYREAVSRDEDGLARLVQRAFGPQEGPEIADLLRALPRDPSAQPLLHLLICEDERPVGQVLFTAVHVEGAGVPCRILAPLSVDPDLQGRGIGTELVHRGLQRLRLEGVEMVFVLGDPGYYGRFGFRAAGRYGLDPPHPLPSAFEEAWMVQELTAGFLGGVRGKVRCASTLAARKYWL